MALQSICAHEIGHMFQLPDEDSLGHPAWCSPGLCGTEICLMDHFRDRVNNIDALETPDLVTNAASVRRLTDPL